MQTADPTRSFIDKMGFTGGVDSFMSPQMIEDAEVRWAVNAVDKGGIWQTRPGFKSILSCCLTPGSVLYNWWVGVGQPALHPQFFTVFTPTNGYPQAVFALSGSIFHAQFNESTGLLGSIQQVTGLQFSKGAAQIHGTVCLKSADWVNGVKVNIKPYSVLMLQDDVSRCGYWDGNVGAHLNPRNLWTVDPNGNTIYTSGWNQTKIGKWGAWSGNRYWVFHGSQGWASDANDPFYFTECTVQTQVPVFNFPSDVTGCMDRGVSGITNSLLFVFNSNQVWSLWSGVQDRTQWVTTPDFQTCLFKGIGCVAGKSITNHMGLMYWYSDQGLVAFDSLGTVVSTQALPVIDSPMAYSKKMMACDRTLICAGNRDTYVFFAVPTGPIGQNGRLYNGHMQVLDRVVVPMDMQVGQMIPNGISSWQGIWTGIRPVEFSTPTISGRTRNFCFSMDYDGVPRIWELFQGNRSDNGEPVDWTIETKSHPVTSSPFVSAVFRHFRLLLEQVWGTFTISGSWKGLRGVYHDLLDTTVTATPGNFFAPTDSTGAFQPITANSGKVSNQSQIRDIVSPDNRVNNLPCQSKGVENPITKAYNDSTDRCFSLLLRFSGVGALTAYRIAVDAFPENVEGAVAEPESGVKQLPEAGCPVAVPGPLVNFVLPDGVPQDAFLPYDTKFQDESYVSPVAPCQ